jgi:Protein of unknown function (DUF3800)
MYIAYLDEFGHIGPYVSRKNDRYAESPVFGLAGLILPAEQVRPFASWFYKRKCQLLDFEIKSSSQHPATWEKKGASLYTIKNIEKYRELRAFTNRFLNKIADCGGHVIYIGLHKQAAVEDHKPLRLYLAVLKEALKRLNSLCEQNQEHPEFLIVMDEHQERESLLTEASRAMFSRDTPRRRLIEPPFQVESHRYQTVQAADWICGLIGRLGPFWISPQEYQDWEPAERYFGPRIRQVSIRSGIRGDRRLQVSTLINGSSLKDVI